MSGWDFEVSLYIVSYTNPHFQLLPPQSPVPLNPPPKTSLPGISSLSLQVPRNVLQVHPTLHFYLGKDNEEDSSPIWRIKEGCPPSRPPSPSAATTTSSQNNFPPLIDPANSTKGKSKRRKKKGLSQPPMEKIEESVSAETPKHGGGGWGQ